MNVWIFELKPFEPEDRDDQNLVFNFQEACIKENLFAAGWRDAAKELASGAELSAVSREILTQGLFGNAKQAMNWALDIRAGDFVIAPTSWGMYVGRVKEAVKVVRNDSRYPEIISGNSSIGAQVEKWISLGSKIDESNPLPATLGKYTNITHGSTVSPISLDAKYKTFLTAVAAIYTSKTGCDEFEKEVMAIKKTEV
jgi:hypothetical protein